STHFRNTLQNLLSPNAPGRPTILPAHGLLRTGLRRDSMANVKRALLFFLLALAPAGAARLDDYFPPPDSQGGWRAPADAARIRKLTGIDVRRLDQAFQYAQTTSQHGGLLVARHGWLVYEKYYGKGHREANPAMASVGKAYTSIACGILL